MATVHAHKASVSALCWHPGGNLLLSGSRDQLVKLFDLRTLRPLQASRAHHGRRRAQAAARICAALASRQPTRPPSAPARPPVRCSRGTGAR